MNVDHVAVQVQESELESTISWYKEHLKARVLYCDATWGLIETPDSTKIAFVISRQHPPHIAFNIDESQYDEFKNQGHVFKKHRDGSESFYVKDPSNNFVEFLKWPKKT